MLLRFKYVTGDRKKTRKVAWHEVWLPDADEGRPHVSYQIEEADGSLWVVQENGKMVEIAPLSGVDRVWHDKSLVYDASVVPIRNVKKRGRPSRLPEPEKGGSGDRKAAEKAAGGEVVPIRDARSFSEPAAGLSPDSPVGDLGIPSRAATAMRAAGIETVADVAKRTRADLASVKGLGLKSIDHMEKGLSTIGLSLAGAGD